MPQLGGRRLEPGAVVGGYRLTDLIGCGGMGVVFRATQVVLGRSVALKIIDPVVSMHEETRLRFIREARIGAAVEHPNVVPVYEVGDDDGLLFISMRYVPGVDLAQQIHRDGRVDAPRAVAIIRQVASALDEAHALGLIHRDVKPHNILLTAHGAHEHAYLTDFGLARHFLDTGLTSTGRSLGTPAYMAPEQVLGRAVDGRCDIYSLGVVLFHALTGTVPFAGDSLHAVLYAHVNEPAPRPSAINPNVDPAFDAVVARTLSKDPSERYQSAGDLADAASAALVGERFARPDRSVAQGAAAPVKIESEPVATADFPARITDAYIQAEAPRMSEERFDDFVRVLRARNWTDADLEARVRPFAPPEYRPLPSSPATSAVVAVYSRLGVNSRTRELLEILPGGVQNALTPAEIGGRMTASPDGEPLSKSSVRAVLRNLQRSGEPSPR